MDKLKGYCIRLANGQGWQVTATEEVSTWLEKLGHIMELRNAIQTAIHDLSSSLKRNPQKGTRSLFATCIRY
jgi:hypothetical protein